MNKVELIAAVAEAAGLTKKDAEKALKRMIRRKHLRRVRMDMRNHQVVPMDKPYGGRVSEQQMERTPSAMIDVICRNCGATNRVAQGEAAKCAYCDSALRARQEQKDLGKFLDPFLFYGEYGKNKLFVVQKKFSLSLVFVNKNAKNELWDIKNPLKSWLSVKMSEKTNNF